jgi:DNA-binding HxlR family transcriptional regulator
MDHANVNTGARERPMPDPWKAACPSRLLVELISGKWVLLLLPLLREGPKRPSELLVLLDGISQKMLTQTLRQLEQAGIVTRRDFHEIPPRVDYALTDLGLSLEAIVRTLDQWVIDNYYKTTPTDRKRRARA